MADKPSTKKTKREFWTAIANVHGCGIRVTVNFNDSDEAASIIKMVLTNKDKEMPLSVANSTGTNTYARSTLMECNLVTILTVGNW